MPNSVFPAVENAAEGGPLKTTLRVICVQGDRRLVKDPTPVELRAQVGAMWVFPASPLRNMQSRNADSPVAGRGQIVNNSNPDYGSVLR